MILGDFYYLRSQSGKGSIFIFASAVDERFYIKRKFPCVDQGHYQLSFLGCRWGGVVNRTIGAKEIVW
jgi:hypothetical protein